MPYSLWSRGRLLGHTDLGFVRCLHARRTGWLHLTPEGERVIALAVAVPPAIEAYVIRARELTGDAEAVHAELDRSTEGADLASAFQHHEALELQLRRDDGSIVPTEDIGIVDTHRLLELAAREEERAPHEEWSDVGDFLLEPNERDAELEASIEHDLEVLDEMFGQSDGFREWAIGAVEETVFPRYQIHVALYDDAAIP